MLGSYIGSMGKIKSNILQSVIRPRIFQMATQQQPSLHFAPSTAAPTTGTAVPLGAATGAPEVPGGAFAQIAAVQRRAAPVTKFDPVINGILNRATQGKVAEHILVAKASNSQVSVSLGRLRDFFGVADEEQFAVIFRQLMVYYMDNGTSPRDPQTQPFTLEDRVFDMEVLDSCLVPDKRRFWRSLADVMKAYLVNNPEEEAHWGSRHGMPKKYREYGFDVADFCSGVPDEARQALQAAKDAATSRADFNIMRADLSAVGSGNGTHIAQQSGAHFSLGAGPARHDR
jgi:hypothetical protein